MHTSCEGESSSVYEGERVLHSVVSISSPIHWSYKMNTKIENPATCVIWSVIRFLNAKNFHPAEIHKQIVKVYGEDVMNEANVKKWC